MKPMNLSNAARVVLLAVASPLLAAPADRVLVERDEPAGTLTVLIDRRPAIVYRHGANLDLPHYYPLLSPSGKLLTVQQTNPYPHHRSLWFADKIQLSGHPPVEFYMALASRTNARDANAPFVHRIRHTGFLPGPAETNTALIQSKLVWEADLGKTPMLDELRLVRVAPLGQGEYLLDMTFTVTATYGDVVFRSDAVHYAWPFVRIHPQFSVDHGGAIVNSEGGLNEKGTHNQTARWVDYSNTVDGQTEGLAIFSHPENEHPHRWLTRNYGTFGPRRVDAKSGKPFFLKKGDSLHQRVGILVHRGDTRSGRVAERYRAYEEGKL